MQVTKEQLKTYLTELGFNFEPEPAYYNSTGRLERLLLAWYCDSAPGPSRVKYLFTFDKKFFYRAGLPYRCEI